MLITHGSVFVRDTVYFCSINTIFIRINTAHVLKNKANIYVINNGKSANNFFTCSIILLFNYYFNVNHQYYFIYFVTKANVG